MNFSVDSLYNSVYDGIIGQRQDSHKTLDASPRKNRKEGKTMKKTINVYDFRDAFVGSQYKNKYSYNGLGALFDYLEEMEESDGVEMELDVVGIACDWTEYESIEEFNHDYNKEYSSMNQIDDTIIIPIDEYSFIAMNF